MQILTSKLEQRIAMDIETVYQKCLIVIPVPVSATLQELHLMNFAVRYSKCVACSQLCFVNHVIASVIHCFVKSLPLVRRQALQI